MTINNLIECDLNYLNRKKLIEIKYLFQTKCVNQSSMTVGEFHCKEILSYCRDTSVVNQ